MPWGQWARVKHDIIFRRSSTGDTVKTTVFGTMAKSAIYDCLVAACRQARLRLAEIVEKEDVNEAMRLMEMSKDSLNPSVDHGRFVAFSSL